MEKFATRSILLEREGRRELSIHPRPGPFPALLRTVNLSKISLHHEHFMKAKFSTFSPPFFQFQVRGARASHSVSAAALPTAVCSRDNLSETMQPLT